MRFDPDNPTFPSYDQYLRSAVVLLTDTVDRFMADRMISVFVLSLDRRDCSWTFSQRLFAARLEKARRVTKLKFKPTRRRHPYRPPGKEIPTDNVFQIFEPKPVELERVALKKAA